MDLDLVTNESISCTSADNCYICNSRGTLQYSQLRDGLFGMPGLWSIQRCSNDNCGLYWLNPRPLPSEVYKLYPQRYYTHSLSKDDKPSSNYTGGLRRLLVGGNYRKRLFLQGVKKGTLLDIGCGNGSYLIEMMKLGWEVQGVDIDPESVRLAREHLHLNVRCESVDSLTYPPDSFDAITMHQVLEHVQDPMQLLRTCFTSLRSGGRLIITCPNSASLGHRFFRDAWGHLDPPRHMYAFSSRNLRRLVESCGFTVLGSTTSAKSAMFVYRAAAHLRKHRNCMDRSTSLVTKGKAMVFLAIELLLLTVDKDAGEHVLIECTRNT